MTLQEAIEYAINPPQIYGIEVHISISMHDELSRVLVGGADGRTPMFRRDLPLLNWGTGTRWRWGY